MDGGGFTLDIAYQGNRIQASGTNSYPRRDRHCSSGGDATDEYLAFEAAVGALIGQTYPSF